jgi:hypothetical protein
VETAVGLKFGDPAKPLLVSVRPGARVSMPGMMDTVLNLGLNDGKRSFSRFPHGGEIVSVRGRPPCGVKSAR